MNVKNLIRETLIFFHIDLTQNLKYDRLTKVILKKNLKPSSNCIDVGCHKGEILEMMLHYSPKGKHFAFEPIPYLYNELAQRFANKAQVYPYALSDTGGVGQTTTFNLVKNAPAYSGIRKRHYDIDNPEIEEIVVELRTMDEVIGDETINFVKIDVEGAEFGVLKGAKQMLKASKPILLFECGKGASEFYGTTPADIFKYLTQEIGLKIFTLDAYIKSKPAMTEEAFVNCFEQSKEYYFVAAC